LLTPQQTLDYLKQLVEDFTGHNIELVACLLETCGLYIHKTPEVHQRFNQMLDLIWRLKEKDAMPSNVLQNLENAFQACRP